MVVLGGVEGDSRLVSEPCLVESCLSDTIKFDGELNLVVWRSGLKNIISYTTRNDVMHAVAIRYPPTWLYMYM